MTPAETLALARMTAVAYDRNVPEGLPEVWHTALGDLPFALVREALVELIRTLPYWPKPAEIRERARLVKAAQDRERGKQLQLEGRKQMPSKTPRTGAPFIAHVLGRLKDAGQDIWAGVFLGKERAGDIAEAAGLEYLERTAPDEGPDFVARAFRSHPRHGQ